MNEPVILCDNLSIGYHNEPVLSGISFSIAPSSFTAILGANGSGKSTLLKTLLGLVPPLSGNISISKRGAPPVFGYVPQAVSLDPLYPLTTFDVALMGTYGRVKPGCRVPQREHAFVGECLRAVSAERFASQQFSELSGGQKQRVLIARALVTQPDILVLDEPTAGVDVAATHALLECISGIHRDSQLTVLLVTHDLAIVRQRAQHVVWLHDGKALCGTTAELFAPEQLRKIIEMEIP